MLDTKIHESKKKKERKKNDKEISTPITKANLSNLQIPRNQLEKSNPKEKCAKGRYR